jgi:hypothetical protein
LRSYMEVWLSFEMQSCRFFCAKLLCTIVMRLNSIQWPINGSIDRSSKQSGGSLQKIFYHVFGQLIVHSCL